MIVPAVNKGDIYNTWLKVTARYNKRPYRRRIDFSTLKPDDDAALNKLERIFNGFPGIDMDKFFSAGYEIYSNDFESGKAFLPLSRFSCPAAIKNYSNFVRSFDDRSMTDPSVMQDIMNGFLFIKSKCENNNWRLAKYIGSYDDKMMYEWVLDYANHKISPYNIIAFELVGFDTAKAVRNTVPGNEVLVFFNGSFESTVLSKIDSMTDSDKKLLVGILKRFNSAISNSIEGKK